MLALMVPTSRYWHNCFGTPSAAAAAPVKLQHYHYDATTGQQKQVLKYCSQSFKETLQHLLEHQMLLSHDGMLTTSM